MATESSPQSKLAQVAFGALVLVALPAAFLFPHYTPESIIELVWFEAWAACGAFASIWWVRTGSTKLIRGAAAVPAVAYGVMALAPIAVVVVNGFTSAPGR